MISSYLSLLHLLLLLLQRHVEDKLQAQPLLIDGTFRARIDEYVIQEATKHGAAKWGNHGNPKVVAARRPHVLTIAEKICHGAGPKVARKVERCTRLPAEGRLDTVLKSLMPEDGKGLEVDLPKSTIQTESQKQ